MRVERSQSLRNSGYGTDSPRPKVSFNRAVHIKRISRKERLGDLPEDSTDSGKKMPANGINSSSKFSTLPSRSTQRNGVKKTETPAPSDRLSRLIRSEPKPEDDSIPEKPVKKKTLSERVRGMFRKKKPEPQEEPKGRNSSSDATDNEIEEYPGKRRGSAPETRTSWFRSLDRLKKPEGTRKERYFGESDRDSTSMRRSRLGESSNESATEQEGMGSRAPSLVYLHTAAVGDIPHKRTETPTRRLSRSVSVLAPWAPKSRPPRPPSRAVRSRATQTEGGHEAKTLRPRQEPRTLHKPEPRQESRTLHKPEPRPESRTLHKPEPRPLNKLEARSLPKLVFTGPSIDETISSRSTTSTIQRSTVHMRSRK